MADKGKLKLVELDGEQLRTLLKGNVLKVEKDGIRISIALSLEEIEQLCEEIAAEAASGEAEDDEGEGESIA